MEASYGNRFERFKSISLAENGGKLRALNIAVPLIHGDATIILDADDYLEKNYIEQCKSELLKCNAKDNKFAFVYTDSWLVDSCGKPIGKGTSRSFDKELLQISSYVPDCALTLSSVLQQVIPLNESIRVATKHHKWKKIIGAGWVGSYLNESLFCYRMHERNLSGIGMKVLSRANNNRSMSVVLSEFWPTER